MQTFANLFGFLGAWNWLIAALILFMLELVVPGVFLLWFAIAAAIVGVVTLAIGMAVALQFLLFALIAVVSVFLARKYLRYGMADSALPNLNVRGRQYVGRVVVVERPIAEGRGKVRVGDTLWTAIGPDLPAGARVRVTGVRGTALLVEREEQGAAVSPDDLPKAGSFH